MVPDPVVTLDAGATSATVTLTTEQTSTIKPNDYIVVSISPNPSQYTVGTSGSTVVTINGSLTLPTVTLTSATTYLQKGEPYPISVTLSQAISQPVTINLSYGGTAQLGVDYTQPAGVLTVPAGQTALSVQIPTVTDNLVEPNRVLTVSLAPGSSYQIGSPSSASVTITSQVVPKLSIAATTASVPQGGAATFVITSTQAPAQDTSVNFAVEGTAQAGQNYQPLTGIALLKAGQTSVTVTIQSLQRNITFEPTDMIVGSWPTRVGTVYVKTGQPVTTGTPILSLTEPDLTVTLDASASNRTQLAVGQSCTVQINGESNSVSGSDHGARLHADLGGRGHGAGLEPGVRGHDRGTRARRRRRVSGIHHRRDRAEERCPYRPDRGGQAERERSRRRAGRRPGPRWPDRRGPGHHGADRRLLHRDHAWAAGRPDRRRGGRLVVVTSERITTEPTTEETVLEQPLLELEHVSRMYGEEVVVFALRDVSLRIMAGEFISIVGPSGSGKSTMLGLLGLLDLPSAGKVRVAGRDVSRLDDATRSQLRGDSIGFVFQQFHLIPHLSALGNVETALLYRDMRPRQRREKAYDALDQLGLAARVDHRPVQMSGGEQQRVALARAIVTDPLMVLADEPTGALDSVNAAHVLDIFRNLRTPERAVVMVTHDPTVAGTAARRISMRDGEIVADELLAGSLR